MPKATLKTAHDAPERRASLTDQAYDLIRRDIVNRSLLPNTTLIEGVLAQRYEMSKTPIREALFALACAGLVDDSTRGWRVCVLGKADAYEIYRLREVLEPLALKASLPLMTMKDRLALRSSIESATLAIAAKDLARLINANLDFHTILFSRAGYSRTSLILRQLQDQLQVIRMEIWRSEDEYERGLAEHVAILAAIEAGDEEAAANLLHDHIKSYRMRYLD